MKGEKLVKLKNDVMELQARKEAEAQSNQESFFES